MTALCPLPTRTAPAAIIVAVSAAMACEIATWRAAPTGDAASNGIPLPLASPVDEYVADALFELTHAPELAALGFVLCATVTVTVDDGEPHVSATLMTQLGPAGQSDRA